MRFGLPSSRSADMSTSTASGSVSRQGVSRSLQNARNSILGVLWIIALATSFLIFAHSTFEFARRTPEYAYSCDPFGYLRMARQVRTAVRNFQVPRFDLESPQTQLLIDFMKSQGVPLSSWRLLVAPHAHLYFPKSG